jgi:hypothetical protein
LSDLSDLAFPKWKAVRNEIRRQGITIPKESPALLCFLEDFVDRIRRNNQWGWRRWFSQGALPLCFHWKLGKKMIEGEIILGKKMLALGGICSAIETD